MGTVLYEYGGYSFDFEMIMPVLITIVCIVCFIHPEIFYNTKAINTKDDKNKETAKLVVRVFLGSCICFTGLVTVIISVSQYIEYKNVTVEYKNGKYNTISGYVENFDPMPPHGHKEETFTINGVGFAYSDYSTIQGYNNAKSKGGVITGNGQHLKIRYINYNDSNRIMYIEELQ